MLVLADSLYVCHCDDDDDDGDDDDDDDDECEGGCDDWCYRHSVSVVSKYRPMLDIIAISPNLRTVRELNLMWGVRYVIAYSY